MSGKIEISPCECGSSDVSVGYESPQGYWVECGDCGYQTDKSHLRELVIAWWEKRAAPVVERQPVTVVLPDAVSSDDSPLYSYNGSSERGYLAGWNACLDKVKELNQ